MKHVFLISLIFVLLPIASCKKKEPNPTPTPKNNTDQFTLKKDGVPYSANFVFVSLVDEDVLTFETRVVYNEVYNNTYGGFIRRSIQPGTYVFEDGESEHFSLFHIQDENTMFGWSHGSLTVLSNDTVEKVMHCTFDMHLFNDEIDLYPHVTDGAMTIHY